MAIPYHRHRFSDKPLNYVRAYLVSLAIHHGKIMRMYVSHGLQPEGPQNAVA